MYLVPLTVVLCTQTEELESNMEDAIKDYRVMSDDPDYEEDTNNAVENVQDVVRITQYGPLLPI